MNLWHNIYNFIRDTKCLRSKMPEYYQIIISEPVKSRIPNREVTLDEVQNKLVEYIIKSSIINRTEAKATVKNTNPLEIQVSDDSTRARLAKLVSDSIEVIKKDYSAQIEVTYHMEIGTFHIKSRTLDTPFS